MITEQDLTLYHNENGSWTRYNLKGTVRNNYALKKDTTGKTNNDNGVIRIFDITNYGKKWYCTTGDVIVNGKTDYSIKKAPITELRNLYGKENVYEVVSITNNIFNESPLNLKHIKIDIL